MTSRDPGIKGDLQLSQAASLAPGPQERSHVERSACRRHRAATLIAEGRSVDYLQVIARGGDGRDSSVAPYDSSIASTVTSTLPLSAPEIGQPSPAARAASLNAPWSMSGTLPRTTMRENLTPSSGSKSTVAVASSRSGGVPASASSWESAMQ